MDGIIEQNIVCREIDTLNVGNNIVIYNRPLEF